MNKYSIKLFEISKKFLNTKYEKQVKEAREAYLMDDFAKFDEITNKLPTEKELLENLVERLKGKSVYSNLKRVLSGKNVSVLEAKICLTSLLVHTYIEQKVNPEYKLLESIIENKLNKLGET